MITVKNAESYLKDSIGEETDEIKKVWEKLNLQLSRFVRDKTINHYYLEIVIF